MLRIAASSVAEMKISSILGIHRIRNCMWRVMTVQIRSRFKGCLVMASYILIYFPQCAREMKVIIRWNPNRKSRSLKMVSKCYIAQDHA